MRFRSAKCAGAVMLTLVAQTALAAVPARAASAFVAGYTRLTVAGDTAARGDAAGRLDVVVWYPAAVGTPVAPIAVGPPGTPYFVEGEGAVDAPPAPSAGPRPFIVVSHGTGGTAMDLSWLCAGLAARGYLVASVTHPGNNALEPQTVAGTTLWWQRAGDLSRVIDGLLANPRFGPGIDRARIGAAGFSLGGHTVLTLAGARSDPAALGRYCASHPATPACSGEANPGLPDVVARSAALAAADPAYRAALAANAADHRDPRVAAVFAIAPALIPAIEPASLAAIAIPISILAGAGDPILPVADNAIPVALALPNAELTLLDRRVGHYTFLTDCAPAGRAAFPAICTDAGAGRVAVHEHALALAAAFFGRTLGGK